MLIVLKYYGMTILYYCNTAGTLAKKGVSKEEIKKVMKSERRKEEKALRRETKRVCLRCRRRGHLVGECPEIEDGYKQMKFCVCYKVSKMNHYYVFLLFRVKYIHIN